MRPDGREHRGRWRRVWNSGEAGRVQCLYFAPGTVSPHLIDRAGSLMSLGHPDGAGT